MRVSGGHSGIAKSCLAWSPIVAVEQRGYDGEKDERRWSQPLWRSGGEGGGGGKGAGQQQKHQF